MQVIPDYYRTWLEFFRKKKRLRHLIHFHFKYISLFPPHVSTHGEWSSTGVAVHPSVICRLPNCLTCYYFPASGEWATEREKGETEAYTELFFKEKTGSLYISRLLTSHWQERSGIAAPLSQGLASSCAAMCKALKHWFRRVWWGGKPGKEGKKDGDALHYEPAMKSHVNHVPGLLALHTVLFWRKYRRQRAWDQSRMRERKGKLCSSSRPASFPSGQGLPSWGPNSPLTFCRIHPLGIFSEAIPSLEVKEWPCVNEALARREQGPLG